MLKALPFTQAEGLTQGEAQELVEQLARESVIAHINIPEQKKSNIWRKDSFASPG